MNVCYAVQPLPKSIFLAGPTPRDKGVGSWRPEALIHLKQIGFDGTVYIPEADDWAMQNHYDDQVEWEWEAINIATVIVFWVPREIEHTPAFTTNVEFGLMVASGKAVLGFPHDAPKMKYLAALANRYNVLITHTMKETLQMAVWKARKPYGIPPLFDKWE